MYLQKFLDPRFNNIPSVDWKDEPKSKDINHFPFSQTDVHDKNCNPRFLHAQQYVGHKLEEEFNFLSRVCMILSGAVGALHFLLANLE